MLDGDKACVSRSRLLKLAVCPCLGFHFDWRVIEVVEILDQWFGADHRYCKLKGSDGALYILRFDENRYEWSLTMFASQEAQAIAASPGRHSSTSGKAALIDKAMPDPRPQQS